MDNIFSRACSFWAQAMKKSCSCTSREKDEDQIERDEESEKEFNLFKKDKINRIATNYNEYIEESESFEHYYNSSDYDSEFFREQRQEGGGSPVLSSNKFQDIDTSQKKKGKTWTAEEDRLLLQAYQKNDGKNWKDIARHVPGRTHTQCSQRWRRICNSPKMKWSKEEDKLLLDLVNKNGRNWESISKHFEGKSLKQLKERYANKLDPAINRSRFTAEEDELIINLFVKLGPRWSEIIKEFPGRPENMVKNRFYSYIRKKIQDQNPMLFKELGDIDLENSSQMLDPNPENTFGNIEMEFSLNGAHKEYEYNSKNLQLTLPSNKEDIAAPPILFSNFIPRNSLESSKTETPAFSQNNYQAFRKNDYTVNVSEAMTNGFEANTLAIQETFKDEPNFLKKESSQMVSENSGSYRSLPIFTVSSGKMSKEYEVNTNNHMNGEYMFTPPIIYNVSPALQNFSPSQDVHFFNFHINNENSTSGGQDSAMNDAFLRRNDSRSLTDSQKSISESMLLNLLKSNGIFDPEALNRLQEIDKAAKNSSYTDKIQLLEQKKVILESLLSGVKTELCVHTNNNMMNLSGNE